MKSIKKNNNNIWMIGSFAILLLLFLLLLLSKVPGKFTYETIGIKETVALIRALDNDEKQIQYQTVLLKYQNEKEDSEATYGMLKEVLDILEPTKALSARLLDNVSDNKKIAEDEFYSIYENLIDEYGKKDVISLEEIKILGFATNAKQTSDILVTEKDSGGCDKELFKDYQGCISEAYVKRDGENIFYIAVKTVKEKKMEVPYLYVTGADDSGVHFWANGFEVILPCEKDVLFKNDSICSLQIEKGKIVYSETFTEKINDKVLSINDSSVKLEKLGSYEFAENMKIYKVFDGLSRGRLADVALGYEFVDFVLADGKICACLIVANDKMEYIRVLIKNTDFMSNYHESVTLTCDSDFFLYKNGTEYKTGLSSEEINILTDELNTGDVIKIVPQILSGKITVKSINRNQGTPNYSGIIEVHKKDEGLVVINEVLLEEYLYTVVPSEMPAYYHEQALMAQAVCARTYAYTKMKNAGLKDLGAHLDDSTSFQVYNNIDEQVRTTNAVRNTLGQIVLKNNETMETMYYSTSCGMGSEGKPINKKENEYGQLSTNEEFEKYIQNVNVEDFEFSESFYRWNYENDLEAETLEKRMEECYNKNKNNILFYNEKSEFEASDKFKAMGKIKEIFIAERTDGGRAEKVVVQGSENIAMICGEYYIRYVLLNDNNIINKQDGKSATMSTLLPSAFFIIECAKKEGVVSSYKIIGGGYGHGNGMSQNGAGAMAKEGYLYEEILEMFYEDCEIKHIY